MVLQNRVCTILMVTPLVEKGKTKCERYWPTEGQILPLGYDMHVECSGCYALSHTITVSTLDLWCGSDCHHIKHFYYTGWPDFGVPEREDVKILLELVMSSIEGAASASPIVCHCSAGVGRTGTVAAILRYYNTGEEPLEIVKKLRQQRHGMVQTKEQFRFVRGMCDEK
jgi:protein tyrosine phosphatase